jgi:hypothetical protein
MSEIPEHQFERLMEVLWAIHKRQDDMAIKLDSLQKTLDGSLRSMGETDKGTCFDVNVINSQ